MEMKMDRVESERALNPDTMTKDWQAGNLNCAGNDTRPEQGGP